MQIKSNELMPAIVQDAVTREVLMLGYMNQEALDITLKTKRVTFFSRSKQRLWIKGETSGHFLQLQSVKLDCDEDTLLILAIPKGPTCHNGTYTCWGEPDFSYFKTLNDAELLINERIRKKNAASYVYTLVQSGIHKVAQKVGEEAVELVIEAMRDEEDLFKNEAADLLFHFLILLQCKNLNLEAILAILEKRKK